MSDPGLTREEALKLLEQHGCDEGVVRHVKAVAKLAREIAEDIKRAGHDVDVGFVESAALLHDIGRCRTHGIEHGIAGGEILRDRPKYASVCRVHVGGGICRDEAEKAGLAAADYIPETLEEKIIAHADNLIRGDRVQSLDDAVGEFAGKLGAEHPAVERVRKLASEVEELKRN